MSTISEKQPSITPKGENEDKKDMNIGGAWEQLLKGLIPQKTPESEAVAKLHRLTDELSPNKDLSPDAIKQLQKESQNLVMSYPNLPAPDHLLILVYQKRLASLALKGSEEEKIPSIPIGNKNDNAFLNSGALVELYKCLTNIAVAESKIAFDEAQQKIKMAKLQIDMAVEISQLIEDLGEVEAKKCIAQAAAYFTEGAMAICQVVISAFTLGLTSSETRKAVEAHKEKTAKKLFNDPAFEAQYGEPLRGAAGSEGATKKQFPIKGSDKYQSMMDDPRLEPDGPQMTQINSTVTTKVSTQMNMFSQTVTATTNFAKAAIELIKSGYELEKAHMESAKSQLQELIQMVGKTCDSLGKETDEMRKAMDDVLKLLISMVEVYGRMGPGASQ